MPLVGTFNVIYNGIKFRGVLIFISTLFIEAVLAAEGKRLLRLALLVVIAVSLTHLIIYRYIYSII